MCAWIGCPDPARTRGLCPRHYDRTLRAGRRTRHGPDPLTVLVRHRYGHPLERRTP